MTKCITVALCYSSAEIQANAPTEVQKVYFISGLILNVKITNVCNLLVWHGGYYCSDEYVVFRTHYFLNKYWMLIGQHQLWYHFNITGSLFPGQVLWNILIGTCLYLYILPCLPCFCQWLLTLFFWSLCLFWCFLIPIPFFPLFMCYRFWLYVCLCSA